MTPLLPTADHGCALAHPKQPIMIGLRACILHPDAVVCDFDFKDILLPFQRHDGLIIAHYKKAWANSGGWTGIINWYRALVRYRPPRLSDIRLHMPVLIQWGKQDAFLSDEMAGESLKLCDHGKLIMYENATHWVQHDEAEAVNHALVDFLLRKTEK